MYTVEMLNGSVVKELMVVAKELQIVGRHDMKKTQLIEAIVKAQSAKMIAQGVMAELAIAKEDASVAGVPNRIPKAKTEYIENAKIGALIAFRVNDIKVLSGMIEEIHKSIFVVNTKTGVRYRVDKNNVLWVKTGDRWPKGVYLALRGELPSEHKTTN
jgi:hypothetical protein